MIVLKKIEFLRPLLVHASILMRFSEEAKRQQLSVSAQKAVWANSIIRTIIQAKLSSTIRDPTLRDVILNLPNPSQEFHFDKDVKNEVMELFTKGINLLMPFSKQSRIREARQVRDPPITQSESSPSTPFPQSQSSSQKISKRFIFFPNRIVTKPIFDLLDQYKQQEDEQNLLITGGFGISKTVSIILYINLSNYLTRFVYESMKDDEKRKQKDRLLKLALIPSQVIKYWYWSADESQDQEIIIKRLLEQSVELEPAVIEKLQQHKTLGNFIQQLRSHYPIKYFTRKAMIDQVNKIAQKMREENLITREQSQPHEVSAAKKFLNLFTALLRLGYNFTLNSQILIQTDLLKRADKDKLSFDLIDDHQSLLIQNIDYEVSLGSEGGKLNFWQMFWFEIERQLNPEKWSPASIFLAKQNFYKCVEEQQKKFLSTFCKFVKIREFLVKRYESIADKLVSPQFMEVQKQLQQFQDYCVKYSMQNIRRQLDKGIDTFSKNKWDILTTIYHIAKILGQNDKYKDKELMIEKSVMIQLINNGQIIDKVKDLDFNSRQKITVPRLQIYHDLKPLMVPSPSKDIKFAFTVRQFQTLAGQHLFPDGHKSFQNFGNRQVRGIHLKQCLRKCLAAVKGGMGIHKYNILSQQREDKLFRVFTTVSFGKLNGLPTSIDKDSKSNLKELPTDATSIEELPRISKNFSLAIKEADKNPGEFIYAEPHAMDEQAMEYSETSVAIDFIMLRLNTIDKKYQLWTFDVTVGQQMSAKAEAARILFENLLEQQSSIKNIPVEVNHVILFTSTNDPAIPQNKTKVAGLNIYYSRMHTNVMFTKDREIKNKYQTALKLQKYVQRSQKIFDSVTKVEQAKANKEREVRIKSAKLADEKNCKSEQIAKKKAQEIAELRSKNQ